MRKGKNRYIVEVNEWGCGLMIKDTQTGNEIDAPEDEVITLCIKEMNSLAKELDTVRSVAQDNQDELKATRIENARLKAEVERLTKAGDELERVLTSKMSSYEVGNASFQWRAAKEGKQP
jgi:predicted nuclease with TOPRIM domain